MKAYLIKPDNTTTEIKPENGEKFSLEELYKLIDTGIVEVLHLPSGDKLIVDEEGKVKSNSLPNALATSYYTKDQIVGNVVICSPSMF